ncbi:MAG: hypothetical protein AB7R69_06350 [Candidatus Babeliales bacterium]
MKKLLTITFILLGAYSMHAMQNNTVKGKICVASQHSLYAGKCKTDLLSEKDLRTFLNDKTIQPHHMIQEVWAWNEENSRFSSNPNNILKNKEVFFPTYLPYSYLKDLKEGDTLKITIEGINYELIADQINSTHHSNGLVFHEALKNAKNNFDKKPEYFSDDKDFLLEQGVLWKAPWGTIKHISSKYNFYALCGFAASLATWYYNPYAIVDTVKEFTSSCFDSVRNFNWWKK